MALAHPGCASRKQGGCAKVARFRTRGGGLLGEHRVGIPKSIERASDEQLSEFARKYE